MNTCGDNSFEIIEKAKQDLLESTNIGTNEDEMKVLYSFLFRCWQMGWLDKYDVEESAGEADCATKDDDLEKAAMSYGFFCYKRACFHPEHKWPSTTEDAFKAGANWCEQQMKETLQTEYEKGRFDMREEMMKDSLDGCVTLIVASDPSSRNLYIPAPQLHKELQKYKNGDKVKIIIVKTEQQ